jgi:hypothetical protein
MPSSQGGEIVNPGSAKHGVWGLREELVIPFSVGAQIHRNLDAPPHHPTLPVHLSVGVSTAERPLRERVAMRLAERFDNVVNLTEVLCESLIVCFGVQRHGDGLRWFGD